MDPKAEAHRLIAAYGVERAYSLADYYGQKKTDRSFWLAVRLEIDFVKGRMLRFETEARKRN